MDRGSGGGTEICLRVSTTSLLNPSSSSSKPASTSSLPLVFPRELAEARRTIRHGIGRSPGVFTHHHLLPFSPLVQAFRQAISGSPSLAHKHQQYRILPGTNTRTRHRLRTVSSSTQRLATSPPARHRHAGRHDDGHRGFHGGGGRRRGSGGGGGAPQPVWRAARRLAVRVLEGLGPGLL